MRKTILTAIGILTIGLVVSVPDKHQCEYRRCPYKNVLVTDANIKAAILKYVVVDEYKLEDSTAAFYIDKLHFEYPKADYEELEKLLFIKYKL